MVERRLTPGMRAMLWAASTLVLLAGIPLFLGSEQTDLYFAWTITPPITAAFLGGAYWSSLALVFSSARRTLWARARVGVPAIVVTASFMLVATLIHLDRFHLFSPVPVAQGVAWAWLVIYLVIPPLMVFFLLRQLQAPGADPPREQPLPIAVRAALGLQGAVMLVVGAALFLAPQVTAPMWPWPLTPLTARAVGAWLLGLGSVAALGLRENDFDRVFLGLVTSAVFGVLEAVALMRYPDSMRWDDPAAWIYLGVLLSVFGVGAYGVAARVSHTAPPRGQPVTVNRAQAG